jgi:hypothetical protein
MSPSLDELVKQGEGDPNARNVKRHALEQLLQESGRENHSEVQWLEREIKSATPEENQ